MSNKLLSDATGYGTGDGLGGWNCRHSFNPYFEGISRSWTADQLEEANSRTVNFEGEDIPLYDAEQHQRKMERNVRRWKREESAMKAAGLDATEASGKVKLWNDKYRNFCKQTRLKQQRQMTVSHTQLFSPNAPAQIDFIIGRSIDAKAKITMLLTKEMAVYTILLKELEY